ncbi:MAG TPA: sensor domain-containing diguanylate cyclase, partial [Casimicrobiaceae bacterium]|nr:sensor domain-containing diguanylate cyclase [Casimicrobiaceae bacterium]
LHTQIDATQSRARQFTLLAEMGALLQACASRAETRPIIERFTEVLFPGMQAAVHLDLSTTDCWALRRGQTHVAGADSHGLRCAHVAADSPAGTLCIPLMAQGAAIGILHLRHEDFAAIPQALAEAVAEQISLCLANLMLREELRELTITDPLTGLYNRRFVAETVNREIQRSERTGASIGLIAIDIDHFKRINDRFGHDAGDTALRAVAGVLKGRVRGGDIACRMGGEEFAVILPGASEQVTRERAEELRKAVLELRIRHAHFELPQISISCGVALFPDHATTAAEFLRAGDQALYRAKEAGRNCVVSIAA